MEAYVVHCSVIPGTLLVLELYLETFESRAGMGNVFMPCSLISLSAANFFAIIADQTDGIEACVVSKQAVTVILNSQWKTLGKA